MFYYKLSSSHWNREFEFKSELDLEVGQCFRITRHNGYRAYPTRFKVLEKTETPHYPGELITITEVNTSVEPF